MLTWISQCSVSPKKGQPMEPLGNGRALARSRLRLQRRAQRWRTANSRSPAVAAATSATSSQASGSPEPPDGCASWPAWAAGRRGKESAGGGQPFPRPFPLLEREAACPRALPPESRLLALPACLGLVRMGQPGSPRFPFLPSPRRQPPPPRLPISELRAPLLPGRRSGPAWGWPGVSGAVAAFSTSSLLPPFLPPFPEPAVHEPPRMPYPWPSESRATSLCSPRCF